jgi:predicted alpha/beta-fold hydrolase
MIIKRNSVSLTPHFWTVAPNLIGRLLPTAIDDQPWSIEIADAEGSVMIAGALADPHRSTRLVVAVHGLGGDVESPYVREIVGAVVARGWAGLRVSMRGAGASSPDFYHAGLWTDLAAVLADRSLARFESIAVIGCSLGGHVALHLARANPDPRLAAVAAICSPLDLAPNADVLDAPRSWVYRRHILGGLQQMHAKLHGRRERFATIREWDARVVVPRWGFESVEQYWGSQSIGPRLGELQVPALYVGATGDPIVPSSLQRAHLERGRAQIETRWVERAGHMGFAPGVDLGMGGERDIWAQVLAWVGRA